MLALPHWRGRRAVVAILVSGVLGLTVSGASGPPATPSPSHGLAQVSGGGTQLGLAAFEDAATHGAADTSDGSRATPGTSARPTAGPDSGVEAGRGSERGAAAGSAAGSAAGAGAGAGAGQRSDVTGCEPMPGLLVVATYNIKSGRGDGGGGDQLGAIAAQLRDWSADVVLLQEVDRFRARSGGVDQAAWLAQEAGYDVVFGANVSAGASAYGTAILSRHPIRSWTNTLLPNRAGLEQRGLLHAVLDVSGRDVSVYSTHLEQAPANAGIRLEQARVVARRVAEDPLPKILGGDLNAAPDQPPVAALTAELADTWASVGEGPGRTVPPISPRARIDYLLSSGVDPVGARVLESSTSDHLPVVGVYRYTYPDPGPCDEGGKSRS